MEPMRLNKLLASRGVCSRREADRLLEEGRVTVDGVQAGMGAKVDGSADIRVDGKPIAGKPGTVLLLYHKPVGVVCTEKDPHAERTVATEVHYPVRVTYAGRLDKDSDGLLLLTNDGDLIQEMMRGANAHEKEYRVRVNRPVTEDFIKRMEAGVFLRELRVKTRPCRIEKTGEREFRIVLTQGLNRQIRRMCGELGYRVEKLTRLRVVNLMLGDLKPGEVREATENELEDLRKALKDPAKGAKGSCESPEERTYPIKGTEMRKTNGPIRQNRKNCQS